MSVAYDAHSNNNNGNRLNSTHRSGTSTIVPLHDPKNKHSMQTTEDILIGKYLEQIQQKEFEDFTCILLILKFDY